ncbi:hypothetical protein FRC03_004733 [Tulasnella sp. 419]|nr:hypothetical protein FRC03_004733 [Tulasnella sp. 419]
MADSSSSSSSARATHPRLHIRNANDAHTLFEAVRLGKLPIVRRRLSPTERELQSGEVFVWEEASYKGGLERWTDGRKWSQSRMREPFLFYEEKVMPSREEKDAKAARRARKSSDPSSPVDRLSPTPSSSSASSVAPFRRQDRPTKIKGLTKQTYSAYVTPPGSTAPPKKWHLTAYFCTTDYHELPVVTQDSILRNIVVPKGVYVTGKGLTRKSNRGVGSNSSNAPSTPSASTAIADDDKSFGSPAVSIRSSFDSPATRPSSIHCPPANDSPATTAYVPATTPPSLLSLPPSVPTSRPGEDGMDRCSTPPRWSSTPTPPPQQYGNYQPHHPQQGYYPAPPQHYSPYSYEPYHPSSASSSSSHYDSQTHQLPPLTHQPPHSHSYSIPPILDTPQPKQYGSSSPVMPLTYPGPSSAHQVGYPSSDVRGECYSAARESSSSVSKYTPRSLADERALGAFRIAL